MLTHPLLSLTVEHLKVLNSRACLRILILFAEFPHYIIYVAVVFQMHEEMAHILVAE
jgi:hypothetical protein